MSDDAQPERRARPRIGVPVDITVLRAGERLAFAVRDLSVSGARLVGHGRVVEGERVRVELALADVRVTVDATVVRTDPQNAQVALAFRNLSEETAALIERELAKLIDGVRTGTARFVTAVGLPEHIADALARDLAQLGRRLHVCADMQTVMSQLADENVRCEAIVVAASAANVGPLLQWLVAHHPRSRRVLLHGEQLASIDHASSARIEGVLRTPWRIRALARALGISLPDTSMALLPQDE